MDWALGHSEEIEQHSQLGTSHEKSEAIYQADWKLII